METKSFYKRQTPKTPIKDKILTQHSVNILNEKIFSMRASFVVDRRSFPFFEKSTYISILHIVMVIRNGVFYTPNKVYKTSKLKPTRK